MFDRYSSYCAVVSQSLTYSHACISDLLNSYYFSKQLFMHILELFCAEALLLMNVHELLPFCPVDSAKFYSRVLYATKRNANLVSPWQGHNKAQCQFSTLKCIGLIAITFDKHSHCYSIKPLCSLQSDVLSEWTRLMSESSLLHVLKATVPKKLGYYKI